MMNTKVNILNLTPVQLTEHIKRLGEPAAQASRLLKYIYREGAAGFDEMTALNPALRQKLAENTSLTTLEPLEEKISADGQTRKLLFRLADSKTIESALMLSRDSRNGRERYTVCISSQVGCAIGCLFCASGRQGFERNLTPGEMIEQALFFQRRFQREPGGAEKGGNQHRLTNVVFMGMGEPLANYDNVRQALAILNAPNAMGLGLHQVTLSTAGLVPQILQLAGEALQFQLAVSLHAANNELRDRLMPINKKFPLEQLIAAGKEYVRKTGRNVFIEYALFDKVNDSINDAEQLVRLLDGLKCSINLIVGNPTGTDFQPSPIESAKAFQKRLMSSGTRTMLRVSRGADIEAGCGQLKSRWLNNR
jgi:23S rRNA (adenine2503-C2)-methyltransferase